MLSIFNVADAGAAASYFEKDDYYFDSEQRAPSRWWGEGAARLGLEGRVDREPFVKLLNGELPDGTALPRRRGKDHLPGMDLTFSAPKSVSLFALVGRDDRVLGAHERAVSEALRYLEKEAAQARQTEEGVTTTVKTENLLVARFNHDTSRAQDPQLHTHAVVLNATERGGAWRALSNEALYRNKMVAGVIYRAQLAEELRSIGYAVERTHADGRFEVPGFSAEQLAAFSKRREAIEGALEARGLSGPEASEAAALRTRAAKKEIDRKALHARWQAEAREHGLRFPAPKHTRDLGSQEHAAGAAVDHALAHLSERAAVFPERELIAHALAVAIGKATPAAVRTELEERRRRGEIRTGEPASRQRSDLGAHVTTSSALATEEALIRAVLAGHDSVPPIAGDDAVARAIAARSLTPGQAEAVHLALTSPHRFVGVQGYAGTGKTTALATVRELAEAAGYTVRGMAPSATAAKLLGDEAGIPSQTIARFLLEVGRAPPIAGARTLWVVDELSMVGNKDALAILEAAERHRARVLLVGDRDQLPSIEAGRAFAVLAERGLPIASMEQILRQQEPVLLSAVEKAVGRDDAEALALLADRVRSIPRRIDRLTAVAKAYLDVPAEERSGTLVLTASNVDRAELNERIRNGLRAMGALVGPEVRGEILRARSFTEAETKESSAYAVGDVVRFGRSYKRLGVELGEPFRVRAIDVARNRVELETEGRLLSWQPHHQAKVEVYEADARHLAVGDQIRWTRNDEARDRRNGERAEVLSVDAAKGTALIRTGHGVQTLELGRERHWDHAYASTVHAAQGRTAERVILHLDTAQPQLLGHESFYVGLSRARLEVAIFTDDEDRLPRVIGKSLAQASALEAVESREHELEQAPR